jgi:RecJ-like exonuclease
MSCQCTYCDSCNGTGNIWVNYDPLGRIIENSGMDDLSDLEQCPECDGAGITELCEECARARDEE